MDAPAGSELLEHTADIGIRAWGSTTAAAFAEAALALAGLMGIRLPGPGTRRRIHVSAEDHAGLLVALLNELLFLHEGGFVGFAAVDVLGLSERHLIAEIEVAPAPPEPVGAAVKAATYHQVAVERRRDGAIEVRVFLDV